jgi:hypothetical protein
MAGWTFSEKVRSTGWLVICLGLAACSSVSENAASQDVTRPPEQKVLEGTKAAMAESHFEPPLEVSDLVRSQPNYTPRWMLCLRSAKTEESKRITRSVLFDDRGTVVSSGYSAILDGCAGQPYHLFKAS